MSLTIARLRAWAPQLLEDAAADLRSIREQVGDASAELRLTVRMLESGWEGPASEAAAASIHTQATTADDLEEILNLARRVTLALADAITEAQSLLAEADRVAAAYGLDVHERGSIVHGEALTAEGRHPAVHERVEDLVRRALAVAREADADAARALRAALTAGALDPRDEQALVDEVVAPELPYERSPEGLGAWWAALAPAAQAALLRLHPDVLGNLEGIPYEARIRANRVNITRALSDLAARDRDLAQQMREVEARISELSVPFLRENSYMIIDLRHELAALGEELRDTREMRAFCVDLLHPMTGFDGDGNDVQILGHQVVLFDLENGQFAEVVGTIGPNTQNIAVLIGGTGTNLSGMGGEFERASVFVNDPSILPPGSLAVITYLGGPMPQEVLFDAFDTSYALDRADGLASFVNTIDNPTDAPITVVGHSYGGSLVGAAEAAGMHADRILHVESAGAGPTVQSVNDYAFPETDRYAMTAPGDPIAPAQGTSLGPLGHGADPDDLDGFVRLETGLVNADDPSSGLVEGRSAHSGVFDRGSTAYENILGVMTGGDVTLYLSPDWVHLEVDGLIVDKFQYPMEDPDYQPPTMDVE